MRKARKSVDISCLSISMLSGRNCLSIADSGMMEHSRYRFRGKNIRSSACDEVEADDRLAQHLVTLVNWASSSKINGDCDRIESFVLESPNHAQPWRSGYMFAEFLIVSYSMLRNRDE